MNKTQRKQVRAWMEKVEKFGPEFTALEEFQGKVEGLKEEADQIKTDLEELKDEEQSKYDGMSEKRRESDAATRMASDIAEMQSAFESLDTLVEHLDGIVSMFTESQASIDDLVSTLNNICDEGD